jgi:hypothetical protein
MFEKVKSFASSFQRKPQQIRLDITDDVVTMFADGNEIWHFHWNAVTRIEAYKRDLFSTDLVCLDFFVESLKMTYPTHEEMQGFVALREQLHRHFPSVVKDWLPQVTFPPFTKNHRVLYEKPSA